MGACVYIDVIRFDRETVLSLAPAASLFSADARVIDPVSKRVTLHSLPNNRPALTAYGPLSVSKCGYLRVH